MQRIRVCSVAVFLLLSVFQDPRLFAQETFDYSILGEGHFTVETSAVEKGNVISLETDLQDVAAIVVTDETTHRELVRVETRLMEEETRIKRVLTPVASLIVDADSIQGRFEQKIAYDLSASKILRITLRLTSGVEVPFVLSSRESMANKKIMWTFNGKDCPLHTLSCAGICSRTFACCSVRICLDCSTCIAGCGNEACGGTWGGGGGGCFTAPNPNEQKLFTIPIDGDDTPDLAPSSFGLHRVERSTGTLSFLMDEWAVLSYVMRAGEVNPNVKVLSSSSPEFGASKSQDLDRGTRTAREKRAGRAPYQGTVLVVEAPVHPLNSRFATLPELRFSDFNISIRTEPIELVVRADFAADKSSPDSLQVLHANGVLPADLVELIKERLEVERGTGTRHRVIVFAKVRVDGTRLEASSLAMVMPKCCCGSFHCN